jgi:hypothetical protein
MESGPAAESLLPELRPTGAGALAWALARIAGRPGLRYGLLLAALAAGLVGSAALLGHALNAPGLRAYDQERACGIGGPEAPDCRTFDPATVLLDRRFPLGVHAVTLTAAGRTAVYYGWADVYRSTALAPGSDALLIGWHGRTARVVGRGMAVDPFTGPPGAASLLLVVAVACEALCALALGLQGVALRLRARVAPLARRLPGSGPRLPAVFLGVLVVVVLAGRLGHWSAAAPLHVAGGIAAAALLGAAGVASARSLAALARRGVGLSEERALRLGADVALSAVLVVLCLSLATDLAVSDVLTLPR